MDMMRRIRGNGSYEDLLSSFRQAHETGEAYPASGEQQSLPPIQAILELTGIAEPSPTARAFRTPSVSSHLSDGSGSGSDGSYSSTHSTLNSNLNAAATDPKNATQNPKSSRNRGT